MNQTAPLNSLDPNSPVIHPDDLTIVSASQVLVDAALRAYERKAFSLGESEKISMAIRFLTTPGSFKHSLNLTAVNTNDVKSEDPKEPDIISGVKENVDVTA